jgi:hypothetical protein
MLWCIYTLIERHRSRRQKTEQNISDLEVVKRKNISKKKGKEYKDHGDFKPTKKKKKIKKEKIT